MRPRLPASLLLLSLLAGTAAAQDPQKAADKQPAPSSVLQVELMVVSVAKADACRSWEN